MDVNNKTVYFRQQGFFPYFWIHISQISTIVTISTIRKKIRFSPRVLPRHYHPIYQTFSTLITWWTHRFHHSSNWKIVYNIRACHDRDISCRIPSTLLHTLKTEICITLATHTHSWNSSLWQHTPRGIKFLYSIPRCVVPSILCRPCSSHFGIYIYLYEYYGGNRYMSIEGIALEHFSATDPVTPSSHLHSCKNCDVFHFFCWIIGNKMPRQQPHIANK